MTTIKYHVDMNDGRVSRCRRADCWHEFHSESDVACAKHYESFAERFAEELGYAALPPAWTKTHRPPR